jgi:hypothetical protein
VRRKNLERAPGMSMKKEKRDPLNSPAPECIFTSKSSSCWGHLPAFKVLSKFASNLGRRT